MHAADALVAASRVDSLCTRCHTDIAGTAPDDIHSIAFSGRTCLACHDPHAAATPTAIAADRNCLVCHDDVFPAASAAAPGATESIHQRSGKCHADISKAYFDTSLPIDLTDIPTNTPGSQMVMAGETINFQCWYRDSNPATTSNFTDGLSIVFQ